jgi:hypothetical protein
MHTSFTDQLAGLDLAGFSIGPAPVSTSDFPVRDAVEQTLEAVWSDLFALVSGTALEADAEDLGWAFVNLFHRSATRKCTALDRATDEVRALVATADGSEIHTHELETQVERAQCAEGAMLALEEMREVAASLYLNEFGSSAISCGPGPRPSAARRCPKAHRSYSLAAGHVMPPKLTR